MYVAAKPMPNMVPPRKVGEPVPEAETWTRVESWVRFGWIKQVEGDYPAEWLERASA